MQVSKFLLSIDSIHISVCHFLVDEKDFLIIAIPSKHF